MISRRVVNSSPLIFLAKLGLIEVLRRGDLPVLVPDAVLDEIARYGSQDEVLRQVRGLDWLQVVPTPPIPEAVSTRPLGAGESAVLAVALGQPDSRDGPGGETGAGTVEGSGDVPV